MRLVRILGVVVLILSMAAGVWADDGYRLWLKYDQLDNARMVELYRGDITGIMVAGSSETAGFAKTELINGIGGLLGTTIPQVAAVNRDGIVVAGTPESSALVRGAVSDTDLTSIGGEGFIIRDTTINGHDALLIAADTDIGLLYGVFNFLRLIQTEQRLDRIDMVSAPKIGIRILNHWDSRTPSQYGWLGGATLWNWEEIPEVMNPRYTDYARANASIGINATILNNVNADPTFLLPEYIEKMAAMADLFRPWGITFYLAVNFASPLDPSKGAMMGSIGDLDTADPHDPRVQQWWKDKAAEIYAAIPDFGGFVVKANSEGMAGPGDYDRTQAEGANLLADAVAPYGGIVMWRAFVYDQDVDPDRIKRAYIEFKPIDADFRDNVLVQVKNGPLDFQPREPISPLFGALEQTSTMMEFQIVMEYLGQSTSVVYLAPMWEECLTTDTFARGGNSTVGQVIDGTVFPYELTGMAGVANIGSNRNWCGHVFLQANWYAFGRLAWDHTLTSEQIADEWIRMSLTNDEYAVGIISDMMMGSREAVVNYQEPLGLHHIMREGEHYGPQPDFFRDNVRIDWTSVYYHRADEDGLGFDRSSTGSGATAQYYPPLNDLYDNIDTCPEELLCWFHHVPWDFEMNSGRVFWDELCHRYYEGVDSVSEMRKHWASVEQYIDPEIFAEIDGKLETQETDSAIWRDTCVPYFQTFSKRPIPSELLE